MPPHPPITLTLTPADLKAVIRKAKRSERRKSEAAAVRLFKSWTEEGHHRDHGKFAHADPLPDDGPAPDPHAALSAALIDALVEAHDAGNEAAVPGLVAAYEAHLDDPALMSAALAGSAALAKSIPAVWLRKGQWEEDRHPRDGGKFASAPGGDSADPEAEVSDADAEHHDRWQAEDDARDDKHDAATAKLEKRHDREQGDHAKRAKAHAGAVEKKGPAREKEDARVARERDKEDRATAAKRKAEDAAADALPDQRAKQDKKLAADRAGEDKDREIRRQADVDAAAGDDEAVEAAEAHHDELDANVEKAREKEDAELDAAREAEDAEIEGRDDAREAEDAATETRREKEDEEREAARATEDEAHDAEGDAIDAAEADLDARHGRERDAHDGAKAEADRAAYHERREAVGGSAHATFYSRAEHARHGGGEAVHKGVYNESLHPRGKDGRYIGKDAIHAAATNPAKADALRAQVKPEDAGKLEAALKDPAGTVGRTVRGQQKHEAGQRREKRAADHKRAGELADKIASGAGDLHDMRELGQHLEGLTVDKLRAIQSRIASKGGRRKAEMVAALKASLYDHAKALTPNPRAGADTARLALAGMLPNRYKGVTADGEEVPAGAGFTRFEDGRAVTYTAANAARIAAGVTPDEADKRIAEHEAGAVHEANDPFARDRHEEMAGQLREHREKVFGGTDQQVSPPPKEIDNEPARLPGDIDMGTGMRGRGTAAPREEIGQGNTGKVYRQGDEVVKNARHPDGRETREGEFYDTLRGVTGVAPGRREGDEIRLPHYQEVLSLDTVKDEQSRKRMGSVVGSQKDRLLNAVNAMSEAGIDYNDPLQVGFDNDYKAHLIDLSNAGKVDPKTALSANIGRTVRFLKDFGAEGTADDIEGAFSTYNTARMFEGQSAGDIQKRIDNLVARGNAAAVEDIQSIGVKNLAGYDVKHAYYARNPRPVERPGILQSEPDANGLKVILSNKPLDADTIRQYQLTPVVHPATREEAKPAPSPTEPPGGVSPPAPPPLSNEPAPAPKEIDNEPAGGVGDEPEPEPVKKPLVFDPAAKVGGSDQSIGELRDVWKKRLGKKYAGTSIHRQPDGSIYYTVKKYKDGYHGREAVIAASYSHVAEAALSPAPTAEVPDSPAFAPPRSKPEPWEQTHADHFGVMATAAAEDQKAAQAKLAKLAPGEARKPVSQHRKELAMSSSHRKEVKDAIRDLVNADAAFGDARYYGQRPNSSHPTSQAHRESVKGALAAGKPVPPEVLADYPDLAPKPSPSPTEPPGGVSEADREEAARQLGNEPAAKPVPAAPHPDDPDDAELAALNRTPAKQLTPAQRKRKAELSEASFARRFPGATPVLMGGGKGPGHNGEDSAGAAMASTPAPGATAPWRALDDDPTFAPARPPLPPPGPKPPLAGTRPPEPKPGNSPTISSTTIDNGKGIGDTTPVPATPAGGGGKPMTTKEKFAGDKDALAVIGWFGKDMPDPTAAAGANEIAAAARKLKMNPGAISAAVKRVVSGEPAVAPGGPQPAAARPVAPAAAPRSSWVSPGMSPAERDSARELDTHANYDPAATRVQAQQYQTALASHLRTAPGVKVHDKLPEVYVGDDTYMPASPVRGQDGVYETSDRHGRMTYYRKRADGKYDELPTFDGGR